MWSSSRNERPLNMYAVTFTTTPIPVRLALLHCCQPNSSVPRPVHDDGKHRPCRPSIYGQSCGGSDVSERCRQIPLRNTRQCEFSGPVCRIRQSQPCQAHPVPMQLVGMRRRYNHTCSQWLGMSASPLTASIRRQWHTGALPANFRAMTLMCRAHG